ncbi:MAG: LytTR family DNA-binding domain-containing protein, partial [Bacteroidota bacterium]
VCAVTHNGGAALEALEREKPDLALLDVDLGEGMNGIAVGRMIHTSYKIPFIFLTAKADPETLAQAREINPVAYIVKPFTSKDLAAAIEIAMFNYESGKSATVEQEAPEESAGLVPARNNFFVKHKGRFEKIQQEDILWVEAEDTYARIKLPQKQYLVSYTLKAVEERLTHPELVRVHRSYIVNIRRVDAIEDNTLIVGDKLIPVSKSYRPKVMQRFDFL